MRKGQFFITTIVVSALAITLIALSLYVPKESSLDEINKNVELVDNALFIKNTLKSINQYFESNWLMPYTNRLLLKVENDFKLSDSTILADIDLPDNAYANSLKMTDSNGNDVQFNINWVNEASKNGTVYFQANANGFEKPNYYLYFNVAPGKTIYNEAKKMIKLSEDENNFWVTTGSYYTLVNKNSGGSINVFNVTDSNSIVNEINDFIKCGSDYYWLNQSINKEVTVTDMDYYVKAVFTGSRFTNETYKVTELFFPERIIIIDEMRLASDSPCSEWGAMFNVDRSPIPNYLDSNGINFVPTSVIPRTSAGDLVWAELYGDNYGLSISGYTEYPVYIQGLSDTNQGEFMFIDGTSIVERGEYKGIISIIPTQDARINYTKNYYYPNVKTQLQDLETEFNRLFSILSNYFYDANTIINYNKSIGLMTESFSNQNDWVNGYSKRTWLKVVKPSLMFPIEASIVLDTNSNEFVLESETIKPVQLSSETSSFNSYAVNTSLLLLNPVKRDFEISLTTNSTDKPYAYIEPLDLNDDNLYSSLVGYWKLDNNTNDETGINHGSLYGDTIGLWNFDEGSGITAYDNTNYNHDGIINGSPWTNGISGSALSFNGIDDHVSITHDGSLNFNPLTEKYSVSFWFSANYIPEGNTRTMIRDTLPDEFSKTSYWFDVREYNTTTNNGQMFFGIYDSVLADGITSPTFISLNQWYHAVGVANTTHITLYVNGSLIGTTPITIGNCENTDNNLEIGLTENWDGIKYFDGKIDEVAIYKRDLTNSEVTSLYNAQKAEFIEYIPSKYNEGIEFDGIDDYIDVSHDNLLRPTGDWSSSAWVYWKEYADTRLLCKNYRPNYLYTTSDGKLRAVNDLSGSSDSYAVSNEVLPLNEWMHLVSVYDDSTKRIKLYKNGNEIELTTDTQGVGTPIIDTSPLRIGMEDIGGLTSFNGNIDEVMIYNRVISANEIEKLYTTSPHYTPPTKVSLDQDSLVGYWSFNTESNKTTDYAYNNHGTLYGDTLALWHFDEGSGTYAKDETTYNNYGTVSGATWTNGIAGKALDFNPPSDYSHTTYVQIPHSSSLPFKNNNQWSLYMWVNYDTGYSYYPQFSKGSTTTGITIHGTNGRIEGGDGTNTFDQNGLFSALAGTGWRNTVLTYNGTSFKGYVDGVFINKFGWTNGLGDTSSYPIYLGRFWGPDYRGQIDEVAIYNKSLTDSEISELYNSKKAKFIEYVDSPFDTGIEFNGKDGCINIPNSDSLTIAGNITLSAWVNPKTLDQTTTPEIIAKGSSAVDYRIRFNPKGTVSTRFYGTTNAATNSNYVLPINEWTHVAVSYDGSKNYVYINGRLDNSASNSGTITTSTSALSIGALGCSSEFYNGSIDEVRIYNKSLSIEEIRTIYTSSLYYQRNPEGLIGYWRLDDNANDYASNNDGTITGATFVEGKYGSALSFDSLSQDYVEIPAGNSLGINSDITLSAWILQDGFAGIRPVIYRTVGSDASYIVEIIEKKVRAGFAKDLNNAIVKETVSDIESSVWHLVTATYTLGSMNPQIYIDGVKADTTTIYSIGNVDELKQGDAPVTIGTAYNNYFSGLIDEVRIYDKALTKSDVKELYDESPYKSTLVLTDADAGTYKLTLEGAATKVNTNSLKTLGVTPITLIENKTTYLLVNESTTNLALSVTTYSTNTQTFRLYDAWNKQLSSFSRNSAGTTSINIPVVPCVNYCAYKLTVDNESPFTINTNTRYVSSDKKYMTNPLTPEVKITSVSNTPDSYLKIYYNGSGSSSYQSDLKYSQFEVNNSYYSFDLENMDFTYKGVEWFNNRGWNTCTNSCTSEFSELRLIENGTERIVISANTSVGVDYTFYFYPQTPIFKVIVNSESNYSFGPSWAINATNDLFYKTKNLNNQILGDNDKFVHKTNTTGPVNYITKSNELTSASIIFDTNVLTSANSIKVNDTVIQIRAYLPGTYWFIINENPENYLTKLSYTQYGTSIRYNYDSSRIKFTGEVIN